MVEKVWEVWEVWEEIKKYISSPLRLQDNQKLFNCLMLSLRGDNRIS
ncbi:hypothetical protein [Dapis sp. BLCC M229]